MHAKGPQTVPGSLLGNSRSARNGLLSHTFCKCISLNHVKNKGLDFHLETIDWVIKIIVSYDALDPVQPQGVISGYHQTLPFFCEARIVWPGGFPPSARGDSHQG